MGTHHGKNSFLDFANHMTNIDPYNTYGLPKD